MSLFSYSILNWVLVTAILCSLLRHIYSIFGGIYKPEKKISFHRNMLDCRSYC